MENKLSNQEVEQLLKNDKYVAYQGEVPFHGGCLDCVRQPIERSYERCRGCQYLNGWDLPDLSVKVNIEINKVKREFLSLWQDENRN